jgi:tetratricopeptide (TPR) repeat protein
VEAVAAYSAALEEWPREQFPLQWARAQHNLGDALLNLGAREVWTVNLEKAVVAFGAALQERPRDRSPLNWAISFGGLGVALVLIVHRTNDAATAKIAVSQIETAYETLRSGGDEASSAYFEAHLSKAIGSLRT